MRETRTDIGGNRDSGWQTRHLEAALVRPDQIRAVWRAHGLGLVKRIAPTPCGMRNESYIVNDAWVIRLNMLDPGFAKFRNERAAYDLLADSAVLVLDESRQIIPHDLIIVSRLPGVNVAESRETLDPAQVRALAREAGKCLARLHEITFEGFDKLRELGHPRYSTWPDCFWDYAVRYMRSAERYGPPGRQHPLQAGCGSGPRRRPPFTDHHRRAGAQRLSLRERLASGGKALRYCRL